MRDIDQLLEKTSRTFALSIPLLPEPTRQEVTLAYLLFRIADTLEDAASWPRERRLAALDELVGMLELPVGEVAPRAAEASRRWCERLPSEHSGYLELLAATPLVFERFAALAPAARRIIKRDTLRTVRGMTGFVARSDAGGQLELRDEDDLRRYCFVVAGIVGEMLTELFLLDRPALTATDGDELRRRAATFGEGLQLVNILKDSRADAAEGRRYLPRTVDRSAVFTLARRDLAAAAEYVLVLQAAEARGLERGVVAFCALPVRLAVATLDRVESAGAGAKLTRPEVFAIAADLDRALDRGEPAAREPAAPDSGLASPASASLST